MTWVERELKLVPAEEGLLDELEAVDRLGPLLVVHRRRVRQRNAYFETPTGALGAARLAFRRRVDDGARLATWTLKGEGQVSGGVASRPEVEVVLDAETPPMLALSVLRETARGRGAAALAEQLADALVGSPPPLVTPMFELDADRRLADLEAPAFGWRLELALDRVRLVGFPAYLDLEIEVELNRGGDSALAAARAAIEDVGRVASSPGTKLSRALAYRRAQPPA